VQQLASDEEVPLSESDDSEYSFFRNQLCQFQTGTVQIGLNKKQTYMNHVIVDLMLVNIVSGVNRKKVKKKKWPLHYAEEKKVSVLCNSLDLPLIMRNTTAAYSPSRSSSSGLTTPYGHV